MNILSFVYDMDIVNSQSVITVTFDSGHLTFVLLGEQLSGDKKSIVEQEFRNAFGICDTISDALRYMRLRGHQIEIKNKAE